MQQISTSVALLTRNRLARWLFLIWGAGLILVAGASLIVARFEANDTFCASCHVEPETTYYQDSLQPDESGTLAAFHTGTETRCIDCHSRKGIPGRAWAQWGGLQNFLAYESGNFNSPSTTTRPVGDDGCSKCHSDLTWVSERPGHYHSPWLRRNWRNAGGPANTCQACHPSHQTAMVGSFTEPDEQQCDACHDAFDVGGASKYDE
jgi:hypothetical protein